MKNKRKFGWNEFWKNCNEALSLISIILSILSCGIAVFALLH